MDASQGVVGHNARIVRATPTDAEGKTWEANMITHTIIRNGLRTLIASLLAAFLLALLAFPAEAKGKTASTDSGGSSENVARN